MDILQYLAGRIDWEIGEKHALQIIVISTIVLL